MAKNTPSFLRRIPSWIKILFLPALNILFFCLSPIYSLILIAVQLILALINRISLKTQISLLKPVIYYAVLLYFSNFISTFGATKDFSKTIETIIQNKETAFMLLKLLCIMQSASLLFQTTTPMQIREGIALIESTIRRFLPFSKENKFSDTISLFINFIPLVLEIWNQSKRAWLARHGKISITMYSTLIPVLFSVGMKKAYNSARAISIRKN